MLMMHVIKWYVVLPPQHYSIMSYPMLGSNVKYIMQYACIFLKFRWIMFSDLIGSFVWDYVYNIDACNNGYTYYRAGP